MFILKFDLNYKVYFCLIKKSLTVVSLWLNIERGYSDFIEIGFGNKRSGFNLIIWVIRELNCRWY